MLPDLLLAGFFDEVLARFPVPALATEVADLLARRLDPGGPS